MLKAKKRYEFEPDFAIPPGETLKETMEFLNMGQKELRSSSTFATAARLLFHIVAPRRG